MFWAICRRHEIIDCLRAHEIEMVEFDIWIEIDDRTTTPIGPNIRENLCTMHIKTLENLM